MHDLPWRRRKSEGESQLRDLHKRRQAQRRWIDFGKDFMSIGVRSLLACTQKQTPPPSHLISHQPSASPASRKSSRVPTSCSTAGLTFRMFLLSLLFAPCSFFSLSQTYIHSAAVGTSCRVNCDHQSSWRGNCSAILGLHLASLVSSRSQT